MCRKAIILDLDNTLYNWIDAFTPSFKAQVFYLSSHTGISESALLNSFKAVFKDFGSVEIPDAVYKLDVWKEKNFDSSIIKKIQDNSLNIFLEKWQENLHLFPEVKETLNLIRERGIMIFGLSDAFSYWSNFRLKTLNIMNIFDYVFATNNDKILSSSIVRQEIIARKIVQIASDINKPNTTILDRISKDYGIDKRNIFMIGDSLEKDIMTAQLAGVVDIWAQYGTIHGRENGYYLGRVTPWKKSKDKKVVKPSFTITNFAQILEIIQFME